LGVAERGPGPSRSRGQRRSAGGGPWLARETPAGCPRQASPARAIALLGGALAGSGPGTSPYIDGLSVASGMVITQRCACSNYTEDGGLGDMAVQISSLSGTSVGCVQAGRARDGQLTGGATARPSAPTRAEPATGRPRSATPSRRIWPGATRSRSSNAPRSRTRSPSTTSGPTSGSTVSSNRSPKRPDRRPHGRRGSSAVDSGIRSCSPLGAAVRAWAGCAFQSALQPRDTSDAA
jgi:hypothetical protein